MAASPPVGRVFAQPISRFKIGVDQRKAADDHNAEQAVKAGVATIRAAIQAQKRHSTLTAESAPLTSATNTDSLRTKRIPSSGTSIRTANMAIRVAARPASPNVLIRSDSENCSAMKKSAAVACVSTHAGPTTSMALQNA